MPDYGGRDAATVDLLMLAGCLAVSMVAYALPRTWAADIGATLRQSILRPAVAMLDRASVDRTSKFQLGTVTSSRDSLALIVMSDSAIRRENKELRSLLGLKERITTPWLPATVLHRPVPTDARTISINVGKSDGVLQFDPVVSPGGLIGYVWSAGTNSSVVLTWMHPEFGASVVTAAGGVFGFIQPITVGSLGQPFLELRGVALSDSLAIGESISTSGLGGVYPQAIPVGRVVGVQADPLGYERFYRIAPYVNPGAVSQVIVLTAPRDSVFIRSLSSDSLP